MNAWKAIALLARRGLWILAGVVVFTLALVLGLRYMASNLELGVAQLDVALRAQQELLATREADLLNLRANIERYQSLRQQGLVGQPDRALWLEQLQVSHQRLGLPGSLILQLQAPKAFAPGAAAAPALDAPGAAPTGPQFHDLQFEIRESLEPELLALIDDFRAQAKGRFRVNACRLQDPKETGLTAQCVLRFFSVADEVPKTEGAP